MIVGTVLRLTAAALLLCASSVAQTSRVSLDSSAAQGDNDSFVSGISPDGRYVVFVSYASNLVAGDSNAALDVFVRDRQTGTTQRGSVDSLGMEGNGDSSGWAISADGRVLAFYSDASNLVPGDTNGLLDVFVHDFQTGATVRASVTPGGVQSNGGSAYGALSTDGRYLAFASIANDLVPGDSGALIDTFVRDLQTGTTTAVSVDSSGNFGNGDSPEIPSISADGRYVLFRSYANNLVPGDTNGHIDTFLRDRQTGTTSRVSVSTGGAQGNAGSDHLASISDDGRYVVFSSYASTLVPGDTNNAEDVFLRDRQSGTTVRVSVDSAGAEKTGHSRGPSISGDGRYVAFWSNAAFAPDDVGNANDVYVRDLLLGTTTRVSLSSGGTAGDGFCESYGISGDGNWVVFGSSSTNLAPGDTNGFLDVFVRARGSSWSFTTYCFPGENGVMACPCGNPPTASGRGCDNFGAGPAASAQLTQAGEPSLTGDTVVFTSIGENNTSTSILLQGNASIAAGIAYGAGVRCVGGSLKRLYTGPAVGGTFVRPGGGDPNVHTRSGQLGSLIAPGSTRYYLTYYRDPNAVASCSNAASTFNCSQSGAMTWGM